MICSQCGDTDRRGDGSKDPSFYVLYGRTWCSQCEASDLSAVCTCGQGTDVNVRSTPLDCPYHGEELLDSLMAPTDAPPSSTSSSVTSQEVLSEREERTRQIHSILSDVSSLLEYYDGEDREFFLLRAHAALHAAMEANS